MDMDALSTGVPLSLFQPLLILPEQHFDPPHKLAPEYRLMIAVRYRLGLMPGPPPVAAVREVPPASRRKPKTCKHLQLKRNGTNGRFERMEEERP